VAACALLLLKSFLPLLLLLSLLLESPRLLQLSLLSDRDQRNERDVERDLAVFPCPGHRWQDLKAGPCP